MGADLYIKETEETISCEMIGLYLDPTLKKQKVKQRICAKLTGYLIYRNYCSFFKCDNGTVAFKNKII